MRRKALPLAPFVKRMGAKPPPDAFSMAAPAAKALAEMLGNEEVGDCTIAAVLHQEGAQTAIRPGGKLRIPTRQEALSQYVQFCGPGDQGCYIPEVLDAQRDVGVKLGGVLVKSDGYVSCTLGDQLLAKVACFLFGGLHLGLNLPRQWYVNASPGFVWDVTNSDVIGGHSVAVVGYGPTGLEISTWGVVGTMTWNAFSNRAWVEEVYATLSPDWYSDAGLDAHGIDVKALRDALNIVKGGGTPDIPDGPTPPEPPQPPQPPQPWDWEFDRTWQVLGHALRFHIGLAWQSAAQARASVDWWVLAGDVTRIAFAVYRKDWPALAAGVEQLLRDLGITATAEQLHGIARALKTAADTLPLVGPNVPTAQDRLDKLLEQE